MHEPTKDMFLESDCDTVQNDNPAKLPQLRGTLSYHFGRVCTRIRVQHDTPNNRESPLRYR